MSIAALRGFTAFGVQKYKVGTVAGTNGSGGEWPERPFDPSLNITSFGWKRPKFVNGDIDPQEMVDPIPQEIDGGLFVSGTYKSGQFAAGRLVMIPRLEDSVGALLYAAAGSYVTGVGSIASGSGTYLHTFGVGSADNSMMPWLAFQRNIPGPASDGSDSMSEYFVDCRVATAQLTFPASGPLAVELGVIGRKAQFVNGQEAHTQTSESVDNLALSCKGAVLGLADFASAPKVTSAQIVIQNNLSTPDIEMIIGSYHPDDMVPITRACVVNLVVKWEDSALYKKMMWNSTAANGTFSTVIQESDLEIKAKNGAGTRYVGWYSPKVRYAVTSPRLTPRPGILMMQISGVVIQTDTGTSPWEFRLQNSLANYNGVIV